MAKRFKRLLATRKFTGEMQKKHNPRGFEGERAGKREKTAGEEKMELPIPGVEPGPPG